MKNIENPNKNIEFATRLDKKHLAQSGLSPDRVFLHAERVRNALQGKIKTTIPVAAPCTIEGTSILPEKDLNALPTSKVLDWAANELITCIPAAGAASRFFADLNKFKQSGQCEESVAKLTKAVLQKEVYFPETELEKLQSLPTEKKNQYVCQTFLDLWGDKPKAFVPTTKEGDTFLKLKMEESEKLLPSRAHIIIAPEGQTGAFRQEINGLRGQFDSEQLWDVFEQGAELSTMRFNSDGSPYTETDGSYSVVSAGHGELVHVINDISASYPKASCLHIRNIDNIIGARPDERTSLLQLADLFKELHLLLEWARSSFMGKNQRKIPIPDDTLKFIIGLSGVSDTLKNKISVTKNAPDETHVHELLKVLFHWHKGTLTENLLKPLSVMGVVQKQRQDVGGGPVFAKLPQGEEVKICLEMPHASESDATKFFAEGGSVTHFNPVLVFLELKSSALQSEGHRFNFSQLFDDRFWLLTKRQFQGTPVCYHETVLYELLGNSHSTNLCFAEVPRRLFVPHKSIFDCIGKDRSSYGFI